MTPLNCIMLVDDNENVNFYHERIIMKNQYAKKVVAMPSAIEALKHLQKNEFNEEGPPELIFLDINMPGMTGWEFLERYSTLDKDIQAKLVVVMLTTSENPDDIIKAKALTPHPLKAFKTKPLTKEMMQELMSTYFANKN